MAEPDARRGASPPQNPRDLTTGPVHKHLIRLTGFMMLGFISFMTASLIETVYVGAVGANELAAISFTFPLVMLLQGVCMGLGIGASSVVARAAGGADVERVRRITTHALVLVSLVMLLVTAATYALVERFFGLLGAGAEVLPLTVEYTRIWLLALPFFAIAFIGSTLMRAVGDAATPGYLMAAGSVLQVLIQPLFIFGMAGAPKLGLAGAAVGFVVARTVSFFLYLYYLGIRDRVLISSLRGMAVSCREILHVGLPAIASNLIGPVSMSIITGLLAAHGALVVAGFGVATRVESMLMMLIISLSMSVAPFVGQNWAGGRYDRVRMALGLANGFSLAWGASAFLVLLFAAKLLVSLISSDPRVVEAAARYLTIVPISMGFVGVMMSATQSFNALGKPVPPLVMSILQMLVVLIPLALIADRMWGYVGIFVAFAVTNMVIGTLGHFWLAAVVNVETRRAVSLPA